MERAAPPERHAAHAWPGWEETPDQRRARYWGIARDAWAVAGEPEAPQLGTRAQTAAAILAVAFHESGFAPDVDRGPCYRGGSQGRRCDSGRAFCMMQIQMTHAGRTPEGYTGAELFQDRRKCLRAGLRQLAASQAQCGRHGWSLRFGIYASGSCTVGQKTAKELADLVDTWSGRM